MTEVAGPVVEARRPPWWLMLLYALPVLSAFALATLLVGDALAAYETDEDHGADLHHLFDFDLAWPFFLAASGRSSPACSVGNPGFVATGRSGSPGAPSRSRRLRSRSQPGSLESGIGRTAYGTLAGQH